MRRCIPAINGGPAGRSAGDSQDTVVQFDSSGYDTWLVVLFLQKVLLPFARMRIYSILVCLLHALWPDFTSFLSTLSAVHLFSVFFCLHLSGSSPAPPLPSFCLSAFADPTIFSSSAICTSLSSSLCLLVCSGRDWGLYWGDEIGRCLPGSLLSQTVHFSVSAKHWNSQDDCRVAKIAKKKTTFPWRFWADLGQTWFDFCQASFVELEA